MLSSQVDGALFRLRIEARSETAAHTHVVYSPPLCVVSKPYLALRAEGDRRKPTSASASFASRSASVPHENKTLVATSVINCSSSNSSTNNSSTNNVGGDDDDSSALKRVLAEQTAQRRLLERLMREWRAARGGKRQRSDSDDDEDYFSCRV